MVQNSAAFLFQIRINSFARQIYRTASRGAGTEGRASWLATSENIGVRPGPSNELSPAPRIASGVEAGRRNLWCSLAGFHHPGNQSLTQVGSYLGQRAVAVKVNQFGRVMASGKV